MKILCVEGIFQYRCWRLLKSAEQITLRCLRMTGWNFCHSVWWFSHHFPKILETSFVHFPACHVLWPKGTVSSKVRIANSQCPSIRSDVSFLKSPTPDVCRCRFRKSGAYLGLSVFSCQKSDEPQFLSLTLKLEARIGITCGYEQSGPDANHMNFYALIIMARLCKNHDDSDQSLVIMNSVWNMYMYMYMYIYIYDYICIFIYTLKDDFI